MHPRPCVCLYGHTYPKPVRNGLKEGSGDRVANCRKSLIITVIAEPQMHLLLHLLNIPHNFPLRPHNHLFRPRLHSPPEMTRFIAAWERGNYYIIVDHLLKVCNPGKENCRATGNGHRSSLHPTIFFYHARHSSLLLHFGTRGCCWGLCPDRRCLYSRLCPGRPR
jgi:hypothetical protein